MTWDLLTPDPQPWDKKAASAPGFNSLGPAAQAWDKARDPVQPWNRIDPQVSVTTWDAGGTVWDPFNDDLTVWDAAVANLDNWTKQ